MEFELYHALKSKYEAEIRQQEYMIKTWLKNQTVIPEHMNILEDLDKAITFIADYEERLATLERLYDETTPDLYH